MVPQTAPAVKSPSVTFSPEERARFESDGYVIVRQLADQETVHRMMETTFVGLAGPIEPVEYEADVQYPGAPPSRAAEGGQTVRRLKEAHARHPVFTHWVASPPIVGRLQQLLGERVVMPLAHHNCVMTKHAAFSSETNWHQDIRYWSYQRPELVSLWLALGHETTENGCLYVIPGTHRMDFARNRFDDAIFFRQDLPENQELIAKKVTVELEPGDALFFHCKTLHAAGRNKTIQPKFSVVFTFRPESYRPLPGSRSAPMPELLLPER
jgi:phytanoyl-CoA hydroxylase